MKNNKHFRKIEIALLMSLCISLCSGVWAQARSKSLSSELVRLHVIAVDDSETEQAVKLAVRDAVLECLEPALSDAPDAEAARGIIAASLGEVRSAAEREAGGREAAVTLTQEYYPTRYYESFALPAGKYMSLRVILGEGEGHNWWCVVFPPLCLSIALDPATDAMSAPDAEIIADADGTQIRFRLVELWGELMALLEK